MDIKAKKSQWMQAIAGGEPQEALKDILVLLRSWADQTDRSEARAYLKRATALSGRWNDLKKDVDLGVIGAADEKIQGNKITHALLNFLEDLPDELNIERAPLKGNRMRLMGLVVGTLLVIVMGLLFRQFYQSGDATTGDGSPTMINETDSIPKAPVTEVDPARKRDSIMAARQHVDFRKIKYTLPEELPIDWNLTDTMCGTKYGCLPAKFLPIGWSADERRFAYVTLPAKEAVSGISFIIRIQNMEDNTLIWEYPYGLGESSRNNKYKTLQAIWDGLYDIFSQQLRSRGILPGAGRMVVFPGKINDRRVAVQLDKENRKDARGNMVIHKERVLVGLAGRNPEEVHNHEYQRSGPLNTWVIGALIAPAESRAALIKVNEFSGYEGPPNTLSPTLIGWALAP